MDASIAELAGRLIPQVEELCSRARVFEGAHAAELALVGAEYQPSARNLLHYLALRQIDLRPLQVELACLGLSSLSGIEAYTLSGLCAVLRALYSLAGGSGSPPAQPAAPVDFHTGSLLLNDHSNLLLGLPAGKRTVRIMVTMPSAAAEDPGLVRDLLAAGMDVMRINCAHDDMEAWLAMIDHLHAAEQELGRRCKVYIDLAGPKLRTGAVAPAGQIVKFRPQRSVRGRVVAPARLWLTGAGAAALLPQEKVDAVLPVEGDLLERAAPGDEIEFTDTRGRRRRLAVAAAFRDAALVEAYQTGFVETGAQLALRRGRRVIAAGTIGRLPDVVVPIALKEGDLLVLTSSEDPGCPARCNKHGRVVEPAHIPCTLPEIFAAIKPGERVFLDDGKIGGRVVECDDARAVVLIENTGASGARLRPEKGINLPDTHLEIDALTPYDIACLERLSSQVDMVGLSFVRRPADIALLHHHLARLHALQVGVVLKIENRLAFENLPYLLLASMRFPPYGVMVARGDLAAEVGFDRLAEVQEEMLWLCEAAHIPVIWATQVLETLAKRGQPSRAEVSDAVMSGRAECVMLNKGPYVVEAVRFLNGVLERMYAHQHKRRTMMRALSISRMPVVPPAGDNGRQPAPAGG